MSICTIRPLPHWLLALSVTVVAFVLPASTARADFFEDLGYAVGKLGDAVTETVDDALSSDKPNAAQQPAAPAKPVIVPGFYTEPPVPPAQPIVTPPAKTTNFNKKSPANTVTKPASPVVPEQKTANKVDDAPPPKAAPARIPVSVVGAVAPLPGTTLADSTHQPSFPKQQGVAPMTATKAATAKAAPVPKAKPAAHSAKTAAAVPEGPRSFALRFNGQSAVLSDSVIEEKTSPPEQAKTLIFAAAGQGLSNPKARISLVASSYVVGEDAGAARLRAFERAQQVQRWLVASGLRPTQMDFTIVPAGSAQSGPADKVDILVSSAK